MSEYVVPCTVAIKRNRVHFIGSDRLLKRHVYLLEQLFTNGARAYTTRHDMVMRAAELYKIESEIMNRLGVSESVLSNMRTHALMLGDYL